MTVINYDAAVQEGRAMLQRDDQNQWRWGEIAANLEWKYSDATLERYAQDVGKAYHTLRNCKAMWEAWEGTEIARRRAISPSVAMALAAYGEKKDEKNGAARAKERRVALVTERSGMTKKEARNHARNWRQEHGPKPDLTLSQLITRVVSILDRTLAEDGNPKLRNMLDAVVANEQEMDEDDRQRLLVAVEGVKERAEDLGRLIQPTLRTVRSNVVRIVANKEEGSCRSVD